MVQKYGFDEFGMTFGPREDGVYCDIDDYVALEKDNERNKKFGEQLMKELADLLIKREDGDSTVSHKQPKEDGNNGTT